VALQAAWSILVYNSSILLLQYHVYRLSFYIALLPLDFFLQSFFCYYIFYFLLRCPVPFSCFNNVLISFQSVIISAFFWKLCFICFFFDYRSYCYCSGFTAKCNLDSISVQILKCQLFTFYVWPQIPMFLSSVPLIRHILILILNRLKYVRNWNMKTWVMKSLVVQVHYYDWVTWTDTYMGLLLHYRHSTTQVRMCYMPVRLLLQRC